MLFWALRTLRGVTVPMNHKRWAWAAVDWALRVGLAGVFLTASILKLKNPAGFATQVTSYNLFPELSNVVDPETLTPKHLLSEIEFFATGIRAARIKTIDLSKYTRT